MGAGRGKGLARRLAYLVFALLALYVALAWDQHGISNDEEVQHVYGRLLVDFYASGLKDHAAFAYKNLYLYGGFFDLIAAGLERAIPISVWDLRHLLSAGFGLLGLAAVWQLGRELGGEAWKERAGLAALVLLALTGAWSGGMFTHTKDVPFATCMTWALYFTTRLLPRLGPGGWGGPGPDGPVLALVGDGAGQPGDGCHGFLPFFLPAPHHRGRAHLPQRPGAAHLPAQLSGGPPAGTAPPGCDGGAGAAAGALAGGGRGGCARRLAGPPFSAVAGGGLSHRLHPGDSAGPVQRHPPLPFRDPALGGAGRARLGVAGSDPATPGPGGGGRDGRARGLPPGDPGPPASLRVCLLQSVGGRSAGRQHQVVDRLLGRHGATGGGAAHGLRGRRGGAAQGALAGGRVRRVDPGRHLPGAGIRGDEGLAPRRVLHLAHPHGLRHGAQGPHHRHGGAHGGDSRGRARPARAGGRRADPEVSP